MQLLKAAGCRVIGLDLDADARRAGARSSAFTPARATPTRVKALVRDLTGGHGADCTMMTAATKSNAVINLAMELTRAEGHAS